ncbi:MAG: hypothetical protein US95_C0019G0018 [Candidatus Woesebacteria bacterium GW2011_GWB1_38_5]|uniref:HEPN domain-containing protein n=2 Tax=Candidatus Woeseibacteriota TaxID=1752722 RepID=A0A0G0KH10_9BACT|nr:MAG: hypothetical protein US75_C0010G0041 [Candidatus Woesebacteria bacterium GW2011_GWC1_38_13]KKQ74785.1 MAG: hypothetical protein US95_C0019G0018 [Candidatus Woesebacteria bacterium GW2011_GWB1_38_5]
MTNKQIWETIAIDLKRAANYMAFGRVNRAEYYLAEAKNLYKTVKFNESLKRIEPFIKFSGNQEDILLSSSLIMSRI